MRNSKGIDIICSLAILAAAAGLYFSLTFFPAKPNAALHEAIGKQLARSAAELLGAGGNIIVIARDTTEFPQPATDIQLASFRKHLGKSASALAEPQLIQTDPLRPVEVPPGDFFELIRRASADSVIVSFMGPPLLTPEQRSQLGAIKPKIVALCSGALPGHIDLRSLFAQGLLHAAIFEQLKNCGGNL